MVLNLTFNQTVAIISYKYYISNIPSEATRPKHFEIFEAILEKVFKKGI